MAQAKEPMVVALPQIFSVTPKLAAEPGKAEKATDTKTEQLANDRYSIRFTLIPNQVESFNCSKAVILIFYVHCHWKRLSNASQTQVVRKSNQKPLGRHSWAMARPRS